MQMQSRVWFLQKLRGIAVLLVLIDHLLYSFWHDNDRITQTFTYLAPKLSQEYLAYFNVLEALDKIGLNFGPLGVGIFFLISGFVIAISLEKSKGIRFLAARAFRIYPIYILGFTLTFASIFIYSHFRGLQFPYSIGDYVSNALLTDEFFFHPGIDGINWSLHVELKFYLLACVIAWFGQLKSSKSILVLSSLFCLINMLFHNKYEIYMSSNLQLYQYVSILTVNAMYLIFMLIGTCFYNLYKNNWSLKEFIVTVQVMYFFFVIAVLNSPYSSISKTLISSYTFALLIFTNFYFLQDSLKFNKFFNFFADISYPLYIVHGVNGYLLMSFLNSYNINPYICMMITLTVVIGIAYLLHRLIEVPVNSIGKKITQKIP